MVKVKHDDFVLAFDFVSFGMPDEHRAYISLDTGTIYWVSDVADLEDDVPEDVEESDRYLPIPHKSDLDLGKRLALRFAEEHVPRQYDRIAGFFAHRGAYSRFKDWLEQQGLLEKWYAFESEATDKALKEWCKDNDVELVEGAGDQSS